MFRDLCISINSSFFPLTILLKRCQIYGTFAPAIEGFFIQFFVAEFFCNFGIHSKNVLMQHKIELAEKYFLELMVVKKNKAQVQ
jgi:hypothetical protein